MRLSILFLLSLSFSIFANTQISFKSNATVSKPTITLSDVATISGDNKEFFDTLTIAKSAPPSTNRYLNRDNIFLYLQIPDSIKKSITLGGAYRITVKSIGKKVYLNDVKEEIISQCKKKLSWDPQFVSLEFDTTNKYVTSIWDSSYTVTVDKLRSENVKGKTIIRAIISDSYGKQYISIPVFVRVVIPVFVAQVLLKQGDLIRKSDLILREMDISKLSYTPLTNWDNKNRYKVKSGVIKVNEIINMRKLAKIKDVEVGDIVTIYSKVGTATVRIKGIARTSGDIGTKIAVENSNSKKILKATVIKKGVVEVIKGGRI